MGKKLTDSEVRKLFEAQQKEIERLKSENKALRKKIQSKPPEKKPSKQPPEKPAKVKRSKVSVASGSKKPKVKKGAEGKSNRKANKPTQKPLKPVPGKKTSRKRPICNVRQNGKCLKKSQIESVIQVWRVLLGQGRLTSYQRIADVMFDTIRTNLHIQQAYIDNSAIANQIRTVCDYLEIKLTASFFEDDYTQVRNSISTFLKQYGGKFVTNKLFDNPIKSNTFPVFMATFADVRNNIYLTTDEVLKRLKETTVSPRTTFIYRWNEFSGMVYMDYNEFVVSGISSEAFMEIFEHERNYYSH